MTVTLRTMQMPRRYKPLPRSRAKARPFRPLTLTVRVDDHREKYPSRMPTADCTQRADTRPSTRATIAPAYNKGAYQVIPDSDIEHIGR